MVCSFPRAALAYHTKEDAPTYLTGHVLPHRGLRVGIVDIGYGILPRISLNTSVPGWLLPAITGDFAPNLQARFGAIRLDPVYIAFDAGFMMLLPGSKTEAKLGQALDGELNVKAYSIPLSLSISYHPSDSLLLSADIFYIGGWAEGKAKVNAVAATGVIAADSVQIGIGAQLALTKVTALTLKARYVPWTPKVPFEGTVDLGSGKELDLAGRLKLVGIHQAYQVVVGTAFSWKNLNLRLGVGYGNFFIPTLGLVSAYQGFIPDIEFYFRF